MTGPLSLLAFSVWLLWIVYRDTKERPSVSSSVWIVLIWLVIHSTRPLTVWLGWESAVSRDEGNPTEAAINLVLIVLGILVLLKRDIRWQDVMKDNAWLVVFYLFWSTSIGWSDYPLITGKRLFKDVGNIVMVMIVLTEHEPSVAVRAVCVRLAYLTVPLSIVLIRYFPEWGRTYVGYHHDALMYTGVTTHKNMLGVLVFVSVLFVLWDLKESRKTQRRNSDPIYISQMIIFGMCWYLLFTIDSVTSLICALIGCTMLFLLGLSMFKYNPIRMESSIIGASALLAVMDLMFDIRETIIVGALGRNMSLTSRTDIWDVVREFQDNPIVGQGFDTFWAGERLEKLSDKTFGIIQAHNGYLETYLNGGWVGTFLLVVLLVSTYLRIRRTLLPGKSENYVRYVILLMALIHNYTEASFNKLGILWFVTVFAILEYRSKVGLAAIGSRTLEAEERGWKAVHN